MKHKKFDINFLTDDGTPEKAGAQAESYFENLPPQTQEIIIDLIASIVAAREKREEETA